MLLVCHKNTYPVCEGDIPAGFGAIAGFGGNLGFSGLPWVVIFSSEVSSEAEFVS